MGVYRATLWGLIYAPTSAQMVTILIPHSLTLLIEGQAYVIAMLAAFLHGRAWLWPRSVGATTRWQGYRARLRLTARLYLLVIGLLLIGAVYEVAEAVLLLARI